MRAALALHLPMAAPQVFISYRRDDAAGYARAIAATLSQRIGADRVFMDVDDIAAGQGFAEVIRHAVGQASVLLVLIGRRWPGERAGAPTRLHDADDFVRQEVAAGLAGGLKVIPLLLDGAAMPAAADLPDDLRALAGIQALELSNARFDADMARLVSVLAVPGGSVRPARAGRPAAPRWMVGLAAITLALATAAWWVSHRPAQGLVDGDWQADVSYDWPNARYTERFRFAVDGARLSGSASFLGVARGVLDGRVGAEGLDFVTRSAELGGNEVTHRYHGRLAGGEIRFVMQTEGGSSPHEPVTFVARRP